MRTLRTVIATLLAIALVIPLAALGVIYSGAYNVAATSEHWPVTEWLLNQTVHNSVAARAEAIEMPPLGARRQVLAGAANYEAMCADCHVAPGVEQGWPGVAMYPQPPRLDKVVEHMTPAQLFWVIKHGIKATGMPASGPSHSAEEIWSIVAFIQQLPQMSAAEYERLQQLADASGMGHHGHGGEGHSGGDSGAHRHGEENAHAEGTRAQQLPEPVDAHEESGAAHRPDSHSHGADGHSH